MSFGRGFKLGLLLGAIGVVGVRQLSDESNQAVWEQAKRAGDLAAAQTESELREKFGGKTSSAPSSSSEPTES